MASCSETITKLPSSIFSISIISISDILFFVFSCQIKPGLIKIIQKNQEKIKKTIDIYDNHLSLNAQKIFEKRTEFLSDFIPIFKIRYKQLSDDKENVEIIHKTDISKNQSLYKLLKKNIEKDLRFQFTTKGIHKDDLTFIINSFSVKKFGSQGQQKTFLIALKLVSYTHLTLPTKRIV